MSGEAVESKLSELELAGAAADPVQPADEDPADAQASEKREVADRKVVAKFLVSNAAAGSIIGKAGASISELQSQSGARLQLSRPNEFFPGTTDRVVLASGTVNQVLTALHLVLTKIQGEQARGAPRVRAPCECWPWVGGRCAACPPSPGPLRPPAPCERVAGTAPRPRAASPQILWAPGPGGSYHRAPPRPQPVWRPSARRVGPLPLLPAARGRAGGAAGWSGPASAGSERRVQTAGGAVLRAR